MTLDLIFTIVLLLAAIGGFFYIGGVDNSTPSELGAAFWPRVILILMIVLIIINLISILKKKNGVGPLTGESVKGFVKSKLLIGMVICIVAAIILPVLGFIPTCAIFLVAYGMLLGEKRPVTLALTAVIATLILYFIFQGPLGIYLPRGYGFLRSFALGMEGILSIFGF